MCIRGQLVPVGTGEDVADDYIVDHVSKFYEQMDDRINLNNKINCGHDSKTVI